MDLIERCLDPPWVDADKRMDDSALMGHMVFLAMGSVKGGRKREELVADGLEFLIGTLLSVHIGERQLASMDQNMVLNPLEGR